MNKAFPFTAVGWGTFTLDIKIFLDDGSEENLKHELFFDSKYRHTRFEIPLSHNSEGLK